MKCPLISAALLPSGGEMGGACRMRYSRDNGCLVVILLLVQDKKVVEL